MHLNRKLMTYTAAAGAAVAANGAKSTEAAIVYTPGSFVFGSGGTISIDFDHNGTEEYQLGNRTGPTRVVILKDNNALSSNAYATTPANGQPAALAFGTSIGSNFTFANSYDADLANPGTDGNFSVDPTGNNPQYLGVQFQLASSGPTYYGWVGVDITNGADLSGNVTGYAYDNTGSAINAGAVPEPAALSLLAVGAAFLARRRRA